ncbi:MAG: MFS transporter, partial [Ktedonobacteraceae bacterium]
MIVVRARPASRFRVFAAYPAAYWCILLGTIINGVATFVLPFETIYLTTVRGMAIEEAVLIVSLYGIGSCIAGLIGGVLADTIGRRPVMLFGTLLLAITTVFLGFASVPWLIAALSFLYGFWTSTYRPAANAAITDLIPNAQQSQANTLLYWGFNIGIAVSPLLASFMIRAAGFSLLFIADAVGTLIFCGLVYFFVAESRPAVSAVVANTSLHPRQKRSEKRGVLHDGVFLSFVALVFAIACLYFQSGSTMPVDMSLHGMNVGQYGLALTINGLAVVVLTLPISRLF